MNLFRKREQAVIEQMKREKDIDNLRIRQLEKLCEEKDHYFTEMISDGLRHGSSLAGKHMADLKAYKNGK